jgi:hypothetical protein
VRAVTIARNITRPTRAQLLLRRLWLLLLPPVSRLLLLLRLLWASL